MVARWGLLLALGFVACSAKQPVPPPSIEDIYVDDFHSDDAASCKPSDVPLGHREAREFFRLAKQVSSRVIHDHYDIAPCYVAGPVTYLGRPCTFKIRAGATGEITCGTEWLQFACDSCEALFGTR
jgi:hypothetical protein